MKAVVIACLSVLFLIVLNVSSPIDPKVRDVNESFVFGAALNAMLSYFWNVAFEVYKQDENNY